MQDPHDPGTGALPPGSLPGAGSPPGAGTPDPRAAVTRTVSWVLAVILPMFVVWFFLTAIEQLRTDADEREIQNAGHVINGRLVGEGGVVAMIERTLAKTQPQIILLGNSLSNTDVNPIQLARHFGIPRHKVQRFSIPNSIGAHWWIVLKNRVYANQHRPRLVLVLSDMQSLLATKPLTEASYLNLRVHVDAPEDEAYLDAKAGGRGWAGSRVWENKGKVREASLKLVRNVWVDLVMRQRIYNGASNNRTTAAVDRVFDAGSTDLRLHHEVIPIMQDGGGLQPFDPSLLPTVGQSFIPEITDLVVANNGRIVYLRPPYSPLLPPEHGDFVLPDREKEVRDAVTARRGVYMDMRDFPMVETDFHNVDHMNERGAKRFTAAVALALEPLDPLARGPIARAQKGREIQLFGDVRLVDGKLEEERTRVEFLAATPPTIPPKAYSPEVLAGRGDIWYWNAGKLAFLSDLATERMHPLGARCSPVRVYEDGVPLEFHNVSCEEVSKAGRGRVCHNPERIGFSASDNTDPLSNGKTYTLGLDPLRTCEGASWLYRKDKLRVSFPVQRIGRMQGGATALRLEAIDPSTPDSKLVLAFRLLVDGQVRLQDEFVLGAFDQGEREWILDPPITGDARSVQLEVENTTQGFMLLTSAVLSERTRGIGN